MSDDLVVRRDTPGAASLPRSRRSRDGAQRRRDGRGPRRRRAEQRAAWGFLSPWLVGVAFFTVGPAIATFAISLTDWTLVSSPSFVGFENYRQALRDPDLWQSVRVTGTFLVLSVPVYMVAGLGLAVVLNQPRRGIRLVRTILFVPTVLSGVAVGVLWAAMLSRDLGAVNTVLRSVGVADPPGWLNDPTWAIPAVVLVGLWGIGGTAIIYLAGLQNIPPDVHEAAAIDGASTWQRFRLVTLPLMSPTLFYVFLVSIIDAFQVFDLAFVLGGSRGGRSGSLLFYLLNLWNEGFRSGRMGYAATLATLMIVVCGAAILVIFRSSEGRVHYTDGAP